MSTLFKLREDLRKDIVRMAYLAGGGHIAPALSCLDILLVLYFDLLDMGPEKLESLDRDHFILSKGHACLALYAVLAQKNYFPRSELKNVCKPGSFLGGHPELDLARGIEASTGALGHGLPFANGLALAKKMDKHLGRVVCLLGDGECQEGSVWEAAAFSSHHRLDNLSVIIDANGLQALDRTEEILSIGPLADRWRSFAWQVREVDGHDHDQLHAELQEADQGKPLCVIAHTIKGKGISLMENQALWHYRMPSEEQWSSVLNDLNMSKEELVTL